MTAATQKTIVLTGADGALGSAALTHFADQGYYVIATTFNEQGAGAAKNLLAKNNRKGEVHAVDLGSHSACEHLAGDILKRHRVDYLFNAAGGFRYTTTAECSESDFLFLMSANFSSCWHLAKFFVPTMRKQGHGRVVFVTSRKTKETGQAGFGIYTASKAALDAMTASLADELKASGVTVNLVAPTVIDTQANRDAMAGADTSKWVTTKDILDAVDFLLSKEASAINGSTITISGGL